MSGAPRTPSTPRVKQSQGTPKSQSSTQSGPISQMSGLEEMDDDFDITDAEMAMTTTQ